MGLDVIIHAVAKAFNDGRQFRTPSFIGEKYIAQNDTSPRLVWVPTTDSFGPPVQVGANPKSYATRVAGVDCAKTEDMANDLIVAIRAPSNRRRQSLPARPDSSAVAPAAWLARFKIYPY